ncbi:MAG: ASCH domain-containing protein [Gemmataceae bacterium]|nr:ASCH domain-containing protein [Gemmataceae bacterium]
MIVRALSLKQPWAALVVAGRKTIEVRRWPVSHRGPLAIHAAKIDDTRPQAWARIDDGLAGLARLRGGVIGLATLADCRAYSDPEAFAADGALHLNDPAWWEPEGLFGFVLQGARAVPFVRAVGNVRLFTVEIEEAPAGPPPEVSRRLSRLRLGKKEG